MMSKKAIQRWYKEVKADLIRESKTTELDQENYNILKAEYDVLRAILQYKGVIV